MAQMPPEFIDDRIAHYRAERDKALETVALIETGDWRFYEARGSEMMREVTDERLQKQKEVATQMDGLIAAYEKFRA